MLGNSIAIIFAGAHELYKFSEDGTSPIASRAISRIVESLNEQDILELTNHMSMESLGIPCPDVVGHWIYLWTGGHAGLSVRFAQKILANSQNTTSLDDNYAKGLLIDNANLLRVWADSLSLEARQIQEFLIHEREADIRKTVLWLRESGLDGFKADKAIEELNFTGLIRYMESKITPANKIYWNYIKDYALSSDEKIDHESRDVWNMIEEVELNLREVVRKKYSKEWPKNWQERIKSSLSPKENETLERVQESSTKSYPLSPKLVSYDVLEMLYFGQLGNLIISNNAWQLFNHMFRDKRFLQDMISAISPVRNDRAHFRQVPQKELDRCRIACDDLLVILEKEAHSSSQT